jgi:hypothetical protein
VLLILVDEDDDVDEYDDECDSLSSSDLVDGCCFDIVVVDLSKTANKTRV